MGTSVESRAEVRSEEPLRIEIPIELDDDRLVLVLVLVLVEAGATIEERRE